MKLNIKYKIGILLVIVLTFGIFQNSDVQAAAPKIPKTVNLIMYNSNPNNTTYIYMQNPTANGKITNLKNSKPSVVKVSVYMKSYLKVDMKSAGVSNVSFYYGGKKFKTKLKVSKWENPCKTFKIGNKDYAKNFNKSEMYNLHKQSKNLTAKVSITPKKGWKVKKIVRVTNMGGMQKIKNNSTVQLKTEDTGTSIYAYFKNKKTGEEYRLSFGYSNFNIPSGNVYNYRQ